MKNIFLTLTILFFISCSQKEGCIDQNACNFDSSADIDDGSCIYNNESFYSYDCLGECLSDADEDGHCDNSYSINSIVEFYNDNTLINTEIIGLDILNFKGIDLTFNNNGKLTNRFLIDSIYYIIDSTFTIDTTHVLVEKISSGNWTIEINSNGTFLKTSDGYHYPYSIEFETNRCINEHYECLQDCEGLDYLGPDASSDEICDWINSIYSTESPICLSDCDYEIFIGLESLYEDCSDCLSDEMLDCADLFDDSDNESFSFYNPVVCSSMDVESNPFFDLCYQELCEEAGYWWETDQGIGNQSKEYKLTDDGIVEIIETLNNNYIHIKWSRN